MLTASEALAHPWLSEFAGKSGEHLPEPQIPGHLEPQPHAPTHSCFSSREAISETSSAPTEEDQALQKAPCICDPAPAEAATERENEDNKDAPSGDNFSTSLQPSIEKSRTEKGIDLSITFCILLCLCVLVCPLGLGGGLLACCLRIMMVGLGSLVKLGVQMPSVRQAMGALMGEGSLQPRDDKSTTEKKTKVCTLFCVPFCLCILVCALSFAWMNLVGLACLVTLALQMPLMCHKIQERVYDLQADCYFMRKLRRLISGVKVACALL